MLPILIKKSKPESEDWVLTTRSRTHFDKFRGNFSSLNRISQNKIQQHCCGKISGKAFNNLLKILCNFCACFVCLLYIYYLFVIELWQVSQRQGFADVFFFAKIKLDLAIVENFMNKFNFSKIQVSTEEDVKVKIIAKLLKHLGFSENVSGEVEYDKPISIGRGRHVYPDIVVNINKAPAFVIDSKAPNENLDFYKEQVISYGLLLRVPYSVLCNGQELRVYDTRTEEVVWNKDVSVFPKFLSKKGLVEKIKKSIDTLTKEQEEKAKKTLSVFEGIREFSSIFYKCEDLIRDIDGLTGADAFDELSMLLFTKMYEEQKALEENRKSRFIISEQTDAHYIKNDLFKRAVDDNPDIFEGNEKITLDNETVKGITKLLQDYTLLETDVDVKGRAFEIFLGKTFTGKLGQFFTPRTIVDFMVNFVNPTRLSNGKNLYSVIDPACGSGGFLIRVFTHIANQIKEIEKDSDKRKEALDILSKQQLFGVDINPRLVRIAKMNMVLHGDGHGGIFRHNGLKTHQHERLIGKEFDLVITNPPFGNKDKGDILKEFQLGKYTTGNPPEQAREILFIEECIKLLKENGELAILLPDGILNNSRLNYVREFIKKHTIIQAIISLPDRAFKASGANSKTSVIFVRKKSNHETQKPVFMAIAEEVGYDRQTKEAKAISQNDLPLILKQYKDFLTTQTYRSIQSNIDKVYIISEEPASFMIDSDLLDKRLDATYFYSKHVFKLDVPSIKLSDIAYLSEDRINPEKYSKRIFKYMQFSDVEKRLGSIVSWSNYAGDEMPSRARMLIKSGDVIAAKVKDSEENVAIIPKELNGEVVSTGFAVLRPKKGVASEVLYVLMRLKSTFNQIRWMVAGTIQPAIKDEDLMQIILPKLNKGTQDKVIKRIKKIEKAREKVRKELEEVEKIIID